MSYLDPFPIRFLQLLCLKKNCLKTSFGFLLSKDCIYFYRGEGREKKGEKHQCVVASHTPPTGDLACNPSMCPEWELNQQPFGSQAGAQSTEPHQPGPDFDF